MQSHRWEELLPEEFYAEFERAPLAYMAAAAPEEHGLHNPLCLLYTSDAADE